jgi:hypothetical protein
MPRIDVVIDEEIAKPAASSFAELIRLPVDRRSIAVDRAAFAVVEALAARIDEMLVPITVMIDLLHAGYPAAPMAKDRAVRMGNGRPASGFRKKICASRTGVARSRTRARERARK